MYDMQISHGIVGGAMKVVVYGPEGIGKTTFASCFPDPIFIDTEGSTARFNLRRTPRPQSWAELMEQVGYFLYNPKTLGTLVIDTGDWAERLCKRHVCAQNQQKSIEGFGYGKGYVYLAEEYDRLLDSLEELKNRGVHVVLNCHAAIRKFEQPDEMGAYDRWELKLEKKTAPLVKEWADMILFANYKTYVVNVDGQGTAKGRNKAQGGVRMMYTTHNPCWDAKNRDSLPDELPFDYGEIYRLFESRDAKCGGAERGPCPVVASDAQLQAVTRAGHGSTRNADNRKGGPQVGAIEARDAGNTEAGQTLEGDAALAAMERDAQRSVATEGAACEPINNDMRSTNSTSNRTRNAPDSGPDGIPEALWRLMQADGIHEEEIMLAVAEQGYFPHTTPLRNLPMDFVEGVLIGAWPQVRAVVLANREKVPF